MHSQIIDCSSEASTAPQVTSFGQGLKQIMPSELQAFFFFQWIR